MGANYQASNFYPPTVSVDCPRDLGSPTVAIGGNPIHVTQGVVRIIVGTTSTVQTLATSWIGRYVTFDAEGNNVRILFSHTSGVTAAATNAPLLYSGQPQSWRITAYSRFVAKYAAATTPLTMYLSSPE